MTHAKATSQKGKRYRFDVLVIGGGIAGLSYILELLHIKPNCKIALVTKTNLTESNSRYAQGGIAAVSHASDDLSSHIKDTLAAGDGLSHLEVTRTILEHAPAAIQKLIEYGVQFDEKHLAKEGGHTHRRIHHAGDQTGDAIMRALTQAVLKHPKVTLFENHLSINLITQNAMHTPGSQPEVIGAYVLDEATTKIHAFLASATVLATGGAGKVFRYTSNLDIATGDGLAMAYRAGARLGNLEFYQFHPTLLYHTKLKNFLISEALRGEGGKLLHPVTGKRFMQHYDAQKKELSTRDIVARAIFNEIEQSEKDFVYLDMRHKSRAFLKKRFPTIFKTLLDLGIDMSKDPIPVVPAAHYLCGGILANTQGCTDLKRLYAIGEVAFTGLHGANRLASNSLLEGAVMADLAAHDSIAYLAKPLKLLHPVEGWNSKGVVDSRRASQLSAHWRGLRSEMTSYAGIIRTQEGLEDLLKLIKTRRQMIEDYYWKHCITRDLIELRNIILVAELIVRSALKRLESRGGHYREDFPKKSKRAKESIIHFDEVELL